MCHSPRSYVQCAEVMCTIRRAQVRLALLQELNRAFAPHAELAFTGMSEFAHTLGAELCEMR